MAYRSTVACLLPRLQYWTAVIASVIILSLGVFSMAQTTAQDDAAEQPQAEQADQPAEDNEAEGDNRKKSKKDNKKDKKKDKQEAEPEDAEGNDDDHESNYFGISTVGKKIIYVVDNSNSMKGGRFNVAAAELLKSVKNLREDQSYYVVLFSDTAYRLGHPKPAKGMRKPTEENIKELEYWLESVELCLKTNAEPALDAALKTGPDTIYLLTDGAFTDGTMKMLNAVTSTRTRIHTIGLNIGKGKPRENLEAIAKRFGGEFREVSLDREQKKKFAEPVRKTNSTRGEVWGLELKDKKK